MKFYVKRFKNVVPFFIVMFLLLLRAVWEYVSPVNPDDYKGLIYLRDIVLIFPASFIFSYTLLVHINSIVSGKMHFLNWIQKRKWMITGIMSLLVFCLCLLINIIVYKTCAHIVDEANYLFQAKIFASGRLWAAPSELSKEFFHLLYFVQTPDKWFSSFFPGQSLLFAIGIFLKVPFLINPFLTAVLLITTVWAGQKIYSIHTGLIAGFFLLCSPFVLFQGASYFSHIFPAIIITLVLIWFAQMGGFTYRKCFISGILTGILFLFRPLSAFVIILFFLFFIVFLCIKNKDFNSKSGIRYLIMFGIGILPGVILFFGYNYYLTGHYFTTPHQLALPNENLGFGMHSLKNTLINVTGISVDLLGLPLLSLIPVVLFFSSRCQYSKFFLIFSIMYCLAYSIYPYHGLSYGPRFYFELVPILLIGSAQVFLEKCTFSYKKFAAVFSSFSRKAIIYALLICIPVISFLGIIPWRVSVFVNRGEYYNIKDTVQKEVIPPAIVSIKSSDKERIIPYLAGFQLNSPCLQGDIIYVRYLPEKKDELMRVYPDRHHYILYMDKKIVLSDT